jgi:hypothetical protein
MAQILQIVSEFSEVQLKYSGMNVGPTLIHFQMKLREWTPKVIITAVSVGPLIELHHLDGRLYTKTAFLKRDKQLTYMRKSTMIRSYKLHTNMVAIWP